MKRTILVLLFFAAFAESVLGQTPSGDAAKGQGLYLKNGCYECHGTMGQGGTGPRIAPRTASLGYVRRPAGQMPPYTPKVMPDADLVDVLAYLMTIPASPPAKSIALLNQ
jgi:ubiquinol-cytochrome c reductase cytochrome c subunit